MESSTTGSSGEGVTRGLPGHVFFKFKPPQELPFNTDKGEIVAILPYAFGPPKSVTIGTIEESDVVVDNVKGMRGASGSTSPPVGEAVMEPGGQPLAGDEAICPECGHPSMRLLRNLVQGKEAQDDQPAVPTRCVGIPTCMNIKCMYISPHLRLLPMPRMASLPVHNDDVLKKLANVNWARAEEDPVVKEHLKFGLELKEKFARRGPPLPVDKNAINFYKNTDVKEFEGVLKKVFNGIVPEIP